MCRQIDKGTRIAEVQSKHTAQGKANMKEKTVELFNWMPLKEKFFSNLVSIINPSSQQLILVLGLVFIFVFRQNIKRMLDRTKQIGKNGVIFEPAQNPPPTTILENQNKSQQILQGLTTLPTINTNLSIVDKYIASQPTQDPQETINFLKRDLADVYFILRCERVYGIIFGSQIQLLKLLQKSPFGLNQQAIDGYFNDAAKIYTEHGDFDSNKYMQFLIQAELIMISDDTYHITTFGSDFLTWLQRSGSSENKPY